MTSITSHHTGISAVWVWVWHLILIDGTSIRLAAAAAALLVQPICTYAKAAAKAHIPFLWVLPPSSRHPRCLILIWSHWQCNANWQLLWLLLLLPSSLPLVCLLSVSFCSSTTTANNQTVPTYSRLTVVCSLSVFFCFCCNFSRGQRHNLRLQLWWWWWWSACDQHHHHHQKKTHILLLFAGTAVAGLVLSHYPVHHSMAHCVCPAMVFVCLSVCVSFCSVVLYLFSLFLSHWFDYTIDLPLCSVIE